MEAKRYAHKYRVQKELGKGGMAQVYLVWDEHLNKQWAMKCIKKATKISSYEITILKQLHHPCIPSIVDYFEDDTTMYFVMDYIDGETLLTYCRTHQLDAHTIDLIALGLCELLLYLHQQQPAIIYRDLKPSNIMIDAKLNLYLIDFGIARFYKENQVCDTQLLGTRQYAAPEQFSRHTQSDEKTDMYAYGKVMLFLLDQVSKHDRWYRRMHAIFEKCSRSKREKRYASMEQVKKHLRNIPSYLSKAILCSCILLLCVGCLSYRFYQYRRDYQTFLNHGSKHEDMVLLLHKYPSKIQLYQQVIANYKKDLVFTRKEQSEWMLLLKQHHLRKNQAYGELCLEVGKLYWFYDENDTIVENLTNSYPWFQQAVKYGNKEDTIFAKRCIEMYDFHQSIHNRIQEHEDAGAYRAYWEQLKQLQMQKDKEKLKMTQELSYQQFLIENYVNYLQGFYQDGILKESVKARIQKIETDTQALSVVVKRNQIQKEAILKQCQQGYILLEHVYP